MTQIKQSRLGQIAILVYLILGCVVYFVLTWEVITEAAAPSVSSLWANPVAKTIKQVSSTTGSQNAPILFDNMDCTLATYRLPTSSAMGTGCFTATAIGLLESDSGITIFNGTDEGLPLYTFGPHQVLAPWPNHAGLFVLDTVSTGGAYISLYKNPIPVLKDQRNSLLQLNAKQLTAAAEIQLKDKLGQRLVINSQSLAFSDGGEWLIAETLNGSFVRIDLTSLTIKPFAPSYGMSGSPALLKSRVAISGDGQSVAIYNKEDSTLRVYDLTNCASVSHNLTPEGCTSHDYLPYIKNQIPGLQSIRHVRFVNDNLLSFEAYTSSTSGAIYLLSPSLSIDHSIDYLGMGDSYTSGEGAFDYLSGTDLPVNMCHLSIRSYPILLTNELFSSRGGHSVACSGAVIKDVASTSDSYRGQVREALDFKQLKAEHPTLLNSIMTDYLPGFIAQQRFVNHYQPAIITVSVGGDDIGFGKILEQCVGLHVSIHRSDNDCFSTYEDRLEILQLVDRTLKDWVGLFRQLKAQAPKSSIYAIGYPQIALDSGNCALNVHLSRSELEFGTELINYLNKTIYEASKQAQINFIDISKALYGHRMCETSSQNVAVNGLTAGKDAGIFGIGVLGKESYHPNALGQQLIKQSILKQTNNLSASYLATDNVDQSALKLLEAPKTGRKLSNRMPAAITSSGIVPKGSTMSIKLEGMTYGLKPLTPYAIKIDGSTGQEIGSIYSNESGNLDGQINIPSDTTNGGHSINIIGRNQADRDIDIVQPILIPEYINDMDGDGQPNSTDTCPSVVNSGIDVDHDISDDACDGIIGQLPVITTSQPPPQSNTPQISSSMHTATNIGPNATGMTKITQVPLKASIDPSPPKNRDNNHGSINTETESANSNMPSFEFLPWVLLTALFWILIVPVLWYLSNLADRRQATA